MSLEKVLPKLIESFNNRTAEYQEFVQFTTKLEELKDLQEGMDFDTCTREEHLAYCNLRVEVTQMVMPLIQKLCEVDLLMGVKFGPIASMDTLGEPCINGGIQLSIMDKVCEGCGKLYGLHCRNCH